MDLFVQLGQKQSSVSSDNEAESSRKASDQYTLSRSRLHNHRPEQLIFILLHFLLTQLFVLFFFSGLCAAQIGVMGSPWFLYWHGFVHVCLRVCAFLLIIVKG